MTPIIVTPRRMCEPAAIAVYLQSLSIGKILPAEGTQYLAKYRDGEPLGRFTTLSGAAGAIVDHHATLYRGGGDGP